MKRFVIAFYFLFLIIVSKGIAQNPVHVGSCHGIELKGNKAVFLCDFNFKVQLKQISDDVISIWYDQDDFKRNNESFAVIQHGSDTVPLKFQEYPQYYEIKTTDLVVRIIKSPFQIRFFDQHKRLLLEDFRNRGFEENSQTKYCYKTLQPSERIYGLGEKGGSINRIGRSFRMWNSDKPCYEVNEDPLYKSIPFFMSSVGYGIFFDNTCKTTFDFNQENKGFYSFSTPGGEMEYYFIYGPGYKQIISNYTELTGKPIIPPAWALGFSQCRGLLTNEKLTREIANGLREHQIPCDIIFQDIGWTNYLQDFNWRKGNYDNPERMLQDLKMQGFKVIVSQDPVISQANKKQWQEADSLGYFTKDVRTGKTYNMPWPWGGPCGVVDFTNPKVADWWGTYQQKALNAGVRGFWTDMGEPAWSNEDQTDRLFMKHYLGMHEEIHNVYGFTWDKVVTEQFEKRNPNTRIFQMTRSAFAGMQRYTFGWSGDAGNGDNVTAGWGKLNNQIPLALSAGMCGIPFWSCDISGYCGNITDYNALSELYVRWMQFGVFNPISRAHHEGNNAVEPWLFGKEAEAICKKAIELKYQLFPYIYTYARQAWDSGLPLMRAMMLEYPDDPETSDLDSQFLLGEELLVAPVTEPGAVSKKIYLPEGEWLDFNFPTNVFKGKTWINYPVTLSITPLFVKKGSIIPQMPKAQSLDNRRKVPVRFDVYPAINGKSASFILYEDDGETNNYKKNIFRKTVINCLSSEDSFRLTITPQNNEVRDTNVDRNIGVKIHLDRVPQDISFSSSNIKGTGFEKFEEGWSEFSDKATWAWDEPSKTCVIRWHDQDTPVVLIIKK